MRPIVRFFILITLISSTSVSAQESKNAATWYRKAIKAYEALPTDLQNFIHNWDWADPNAPISDEMRLAIAKIQPILRLATRGSKQQHSDFNLAYEEGFDLALPHLSSMRGITRFAMADVSIRLRDGDSATAAAELASMYRMSAHLNSDRILISSLVGNAMFDISDTIVQIGLDNAAFDAVDSATMMEALDQFSETDPFEYVEALIMDGEITTEWLSNKYGDKEDGGALLAEDLTWLSPYGKIREDLAAATQEEFTESLDQVDAVVNRVVAAFLDPDEEAGKAAVKKIIEEVKNGEHGVLASVLIPVYGKIIDKMHVAEQKLAERKAALALLLTGEVSPKQVANAMVWYLRAISLLPEIEKEIRDQWKTLAIKFDKPVDEELTKSLTEAESLISIVREASQMNRCDFAAATRNEILAIPEYLPGFRELANLLIADANRLFDLGEADAAFDRLEICLRMSAHLAKDKSIASALISHKIFTLASTVLQKPLTLAFLEDVHRVLIEDALATMGRKDPFGYITSITETRESIKNWLWSSTRGAIEKDEALSKILRNCPADRLFSIFSMMRRWNIDKLVWSEAPTDTLHPLNDVLDLDALGEVISQVPQWLEAIKAKQHISILEIERPVISPVRQQLARARGDFRKAVLALKD